MKDLVDFVKECQVDADILERTVGECLHALKLLSLNAEEVKYLAKEKMTAARNVSTANAFSIAKPKDVSDIIHLSTLVKDSEYVAELDKDLRCVGAKLEVIQEQSLATSLLRLESAKQQVASSSFNRPTAESSFPRAVADLFVRAAPISSDTFVDSLQLAARMYSGRMTDSLAAIAKCRDSDSMAEMATALACEDFVESLQEDVDFVTSVSHVSDSDLQRHFEEQKMRSAANEPIASASTSPAHTLLVEASDDPFLLPPARHIFSHRYSYQDVDELKLVLRCRVERRRQELMTLLLRVGEQADPRETLSLLSTCGRSVAVVALRS